MTKKISELTEDTSPAPSSQIELNVGGASRRSTLANILIELIPSSAQGDILYFNGTTWVRLGAGTAGQVLQTQGAGENPQWATASASVKGRAEFLVATVPLTLGAPIAGLDGLSTPAEGIPYFEFVNGSVTYREFYCRLIGYSGGGLTLRFEVLRTSGGAAATYIFEAAIRRINTATEDLGASHTYDYNAVTVTIPAGPPNAGIPMAGTITFTNGADMDSLADNELFILRFRRNGGTATDTARVPASITLQET